MGVTLSQEPPPHDRFEGTSAASVTPLIGWAGQAETDAMLSAADEVARLLTLLADPLVPASTRQRLERRLTAAREQRNETASRVLVDGLRSRVGLGALRGGQHAAAVELLLRCGAAWPGGVSVCETCAVIFDHPYSARRARCDRCHGRGDRAVPSVPLTGDDGSVAWLDLVERYRECECCGSPFVGRAGARTCSPRCRKGLERGATLEPVLDVDQAQTGTASPAARPCRSCGRSGPWLARCGPCGEPQAA